MKTAAAPSSPDHVDPVARAQVLDREEHRAAGPGVHVPRNHRRPGDPRHHAAGVKAGQVVVIQRRDRDAAVGVQAEPGDRGVDLQDRDLDPHRGRGRERRRHRPPLTSGTAVPTVRGICCASASRSPLGPPASAHTAANPPRASGRRTSRRTWPRQILCRNGGVPSASRHRHRRDGVRLAATSFARSGPRPSW